MIRSHYSVNDILLITLLTLVTVSAPALGNTPVVGPETPVCPTFGPAPGNQEAASIAASPYGYLAVWADTRGPNDSDIFACRISATGEVLDILGICVSSYAGKQITPSVAWNGTEYLVVWADRRDPLQHIYGARVRPNGEVLDPQGILLSGTTASQLAPRVAGESSGWLVVWQDTKGSSADIYGCKVNSDSTRGKIYGIATRVDNEETPDVAYNGSTYFVVWRDYRNSADTDTDIYGCRVSRLGVRMAGDVLVSCTSSGTVGAVGAQLSPRICAAGTSCTVVWEDYRNGATNSDVYGARVSSSGTVYDKGGIAVSRATGNEELPNIGYDGSRLLVIWRRGTDRVLRGARLGTDGSVTDSNGIAISSGMAGSSGSCVAGTAGAFVAGWSSFSVTNSDALTTLVTDAGAVQNPQGTLTSSALDDELNYSVADNGSEYAVVWSQMVNGNHDIVAARLSHAGVPLNVSPMNVTSIYSGEQVQPSIAWNGSKYLVVWCGNESFNSTDWDIRGWFLDANLNRIGAQPLQVCSATGDQTNPCVASNGNNFLVAWEDSRNAISPYYETDIYGATVSSAGTVVVTSPPIGPATGSQHNPKIASNGTDYFVVWEDYRNGAYPGYPVIYGTRVSSSAQVKDANGIALPQVTYYQTAPNVCYGGGNYFVVWSDYYRISGCRVSTAGALLDTSGLNIDSGSKIKACPSACWDGTGYRVVWEDYRSNDSTNSDIYYTTVGSNGAVSPFPRVALVSDLKPQLAPRMFFSGGAGILMYSRLYNHSHCTSSVTLQEQPIHEIDSIAAAKLLPAGTTVALSDKVVTAVFPGYFYI
ncbi:MAG: hypothetical protein ACYC64_07680, partial [Armatimonadota bacterium]